MKIAYSEEALSILESLQIQAEHKNPYMPRSSFTDQELADNMVRNSSNLTNSQAGLDGTVNFFRSYQNRLPTAHEDPVDYPKLVMLFELVSVQAGQMGFELPEKVGLGTVSSGQLNAHLLTLGQSKDEYLLVYNRQIFLFVDFFARYIAGLISTEVQKCARNQYISPRKPEPTEIQTLDELVYFLINQVEFYRDPGGEIGLIISMDKQPNRVPVIETDDVGTAFKEMMHVPMLSFVIGHELIHLHLNYRRSIGKPVNLKNAFYEELFCDTQAMLITTQVAKKLYQPDYPQGWQKFATVAPILFLSCLDICHKAAYVLANGRLPPGMMEEVELPDLEKNQMDGYPTTLLRLSVVHSQLRQIVNEQAAPYPGDWVFENSDWIDQFFVDCWTGMKENYLHRYVSRQRMLDFYHNELKGRK